MNRFFAIPLLFFLLFSADECGDAFGQIMGVGTETDMSLHADSGVQAAGRAPEAMAAQVQAFENRQAAISKENLAKGEKASLDKIDNAIELAPNDPYMQATKAAMQVAMGVDSRESEGKTLTVIQRNESTASDAKFYYELHMSLALRDISLNLPPGPARDRVNKMLCPHVLAAKKAGDTSYDGVAC